MKMGDNKMAGSMGMKVKMSGQGGLDIFRYLEKCICTGNVVL